MAEPQKPTGGEAEAEQTIEALSYLQRLYENQYAAVTQGLSGMLDELGRMNSAQATVANLGSIAQKEALMPIGSDVYVTVRTSDSKSVIMGVGANYFIEADAVAASKLMANLVAKQRKQIDSLMRSKRELEQAMVDVDDKLARMAEAGR
ncbi:MAG: prefoldin subunit alpha [Candidatus Marsarchaeota archaeon]|jgi:prefoldin alpha subunit|nr:prefoldin subunit alpha [Candidatus Marsarchaeota archaeon]